MDTPNVKQNTSYKDILSSIGTQLKQRQGLIAIRVAFVSLPLILTAVPLIYFGELTKDIDISNEQKGVLFVILLWLVLFIGLPWAVIMGQIFKIERIIWIDSFFDNVPLSNKESWKLAKKLFWPSILTDLIVFLRYYLPAIVLSVGLFGLYVVLTAERVIPFNGWMLVGLMVVILAAFTVYAYFVNVHLRYLLFLLVDNYKTQTFSYRSLFGEMRRLNRTTKAGEFTKMLVTVLGAEAAESAISTVMGMLNGVVASHTSGVGKVATQAAAMYANEVVTTNKKYAQTITFYVFYRVARELTYGKAQNINQEFYSVVKTDALLQQQDSK